MFFASREKSALSKMGFITGKNGVLRTTMELSGHWPDF
jgi:hypothetical protein